MDAFISAQFDNCIKSLKKYNISAAYVHLQKAHDRLLSIPKNSIQWAIYYLNLSSIYNNSGRFQDSIGCCVTAGKIIKKHRNRKLEAEVASHMASAYLNFGDYASARKNIRKAISIYEKEKQKEALSDTLLTLSQILLRNGEWSGAIKESSKALLLALQSGNKQMIGEALIRLGYIFRADPDMFQEGGYRYLAIDYFRQAERYFKELGYIPGLVEALYERANTYVSLNMSKKSRELMKRIEDMTPPNSPMRFFLLNLEYCLNNRELKFEQAIANAQQLYKFYERAGDKKGVADSLEKQGSAYYNLADMVRAKKCGQKALELAIEIGDELIQNKSRSLITVAEKAAEPRRNGVVPEYVTER